MHNFFSIVVYEGGPVISQARSLWRLELARTKWAGAFINWFHPIRIRHITTGRYLALGENNALTLVTRDEASVVSTCFYLRPEKDDSKVGRGHIHNEMVRAWQVYENASVFCVFTW